MGRLTTVTSALSAFDALASLAWGALLFFGPQPVGDFILQRPTDGVHWHLLRCVGGQILSSTIFFRFRHSREETRTSLRLVRVLAWALTLLITLHARSVSPGLLEPRFGRGLVYAGFGSIAFYLLLLVASGWPLGGSLNPASWFGNFLYQLDALASICIGTAWIACPSWLLHRQVKVSMDESHELCARFMGVLFVSSYILSTHALHWKDLRDRSLAAEARAFCCFFILSAQLWSQWAYARDWSGSHWVGIALFSIWTVVSFSYSLYLHCTMPSKDKRQ